MSNGTVLLLPHQERFLQSPKNFPEIRWHFLLAGYGAGKALYYKEITPTPDGFREFGDIRVGDMVFDDRGRPVRVLGVYEQGLLDAYRVTLSDGRSVICSAEHLWGVYYNSHGGLRYKVMELSEMLRKGVRRPDPRYTKAGGKPKFWIPASPVCFYPDREFPLDPYVLGSLIGNGCLTLPALTLSSADEWQVKKVASRLGAEPRKNKCTYSWTFWRNGHNIKTRDVVPEGLRCLAGHKYIPDEYLMSGEGQRRELLQGLFDTDGSVDSSANRLHVSYSTTSARLAEDVRNLLLSMGIVSTITEDVREGRNTCYNVIVSASQERKAWLFSLPRKLSRVTSFPRPDRRDYSRVAVYSVEKLPEKLPMRCIRVDSPEGLFLCRDFIVTHNTRSLAIAVLKEIADMDGEKDDGGLGVRLAVAGYTYAHLEQTFMIDFKAYLDASKTPYHEDTKNHIITVGTVQVIFLQLCEPGRIFGQSVYKSFCDEVDELEENVMIEAMKSVSQRTRQVVPGHRPPCIMAASTAQGMRGFYRLYSSYKKNGVGFVLVRARTQDNWYLPREYIEDLWKNFTETERKVYMEGEFLTVAQGRVVPGFDWDRNFVPVDMDLELRPGERVYIGQDINVGYSRGSAWVSRDGVMWCVKSYDFPDIGAAPKVYRHDFPYQDIFWLPDVTSKDMYPQFARELRAYDIHIIHRSKSPLVEDSCFLLSKLCYTGRVRITKQASAVADALATASRDKNNRIPKGVGESSPIHMLDGARYATSYMALVLPEYRDVRGGLMQHLASYRRSLEEDGDNDAPVRYNGAGYTQIEGTAYM